MIASKFLVDLTFGTSSESGLNLVPREGPPTYRASELMQAFAVKFGAYKNYGLGRCCSRTHAIDFRP